MLELYQFESCPYCAKVRRVLGDLELDWIARSAPPGSRHSVELLAREGKSQVPYLYDPSTDARMFESDEIIDYLYATYGTRVERIGVA